MKKIVLISCVSKKLSYKSDAKNLYISPLFRYNLKYALSLKPDKIFILSAKYGLIKLDDKITPYNKTLNKMKKAERQEWAKKVLMQLSAETDINNDEIIFLAGKNYREYLIPHISNYEIPLEGMGIGKQLKFLKNKLK